ncbi:MAG TPA: hypothetical protein VNZ23_01630 [Xanthobacteraceae bacterium]|nr:hypothetical protein [Xanthobacteraceae bacterium]
MKDAHLRRVPHCRRALGWGYPEMRAKRWATLVMVALQRAIEDQTPF